MEKEVLIWRRKCLYGEGGAYMNKVSIWRREVGWGPWTCHLYENALVRTYDMSEYMNVWLRQHEFMLTIRQHECLADIYVDVYLSQVIRDT